MTSAQPPGAAPKNRLSVAQMLHVMRVEFHRSRQKRQPLVCLMIAVDGLDEAREKHGYETKQALLKAAYDLLKRVSGAHAFIGMALMAGDRIMAVFPDTTPARGSELGRWLLEERATVRVPTPGGELELSVSAGAAHNLLAETSSSFEGLVQMAGRSLMMAREAGGGRYVMWREHEAELRELHDELENRKQAFAAEQAVLEEEAAGVGELARGEVLDKIQALFAQSPRTDDLAALERQVLALAAKELFDERQKAVRAQMAEHKRLVDQLERRIAKLTDLLGVTEEELKRVLAMKSIDPGVASIYREVQGLADSGEHAAAKKAMMSAIFEANLAIQKKDEPAGAAA